MLAAIIFVLYKIVELFVVLQREYKRKIEQIKSSNPVQKYINSLIFFKGENFSYKDVRDSEVERVLRDITQEYDFSKINKGIIKEAIKQAITEHKGIESIKVVKEISEIKKSIEIKDIPISITEIDRMSGIEFENFLKKFFEKRGFYVKLTPGSGDQGVDLILKKDNRKIALQAKRYSPSVKVGNKAIQEVNTGMQYYDCTEAYVITTSDFTNPAFNLAKKVGVQLIDRRKLELLIKDKTKL